MILQVDIHCYGCAAFLAQVLEEIGEEDSRVVEIKGPNRFCGVHWCMDCSIVLDVEKRLSEGA